MSIQQRILHQFERRFSPVPAYVLRAPGRVNLIGEHTDYNEGFVLPIAIDRAVWIALSPRSDQQVNIEALDYADSASISLDDLYSAEKGWAEYIKGVAWALLNCGYLLQGWDGVIAGDVPIGAGLASSAALELAATRAFTITSDLEWQAVEMAQLVQGAENHWVGMNCGIMDPLISAKGMAGHALLIDCRSLKIETVPLPPHTVVAVLDTATRRDLVDSAYNDRRAQCEQAASCLGVAALRDISCEQFDALSSQLDPILWRRVQHVISENDRTLQAAAAMKEGDVTQLGRLMNASHTSLRDDFEVSSKELDLMVICANEAPGCYGARMTGAGFGGCAVALVQAGLADVFTDSVTYKYQAAAQLAPKIYICKASNGVELVSV